MNTKQKVKQIVFDQCNGFFGKLKVSVPDDIPDDALFDDLSIDSIDFIELIMEIESQFDIDIQDDICLNWKKVSDAVLYVEGLNGT